MVPGSVVVELAVMPPVWLTVFPALERARLVAVLQEGAAPLFGELAYDVAVVYPVQQPPVRGPHSHPQELRACYVPSSAVCTCAKLEAGESRRQAGRKAWR